MKIAVCCSSSDNIEQKYLEISKKLLEQIFNQNNDLVFGAMNNGIMGIAYRIAKANNRHILGITPEMYKDDFKQLDCDEEIITHNINDRTQKLIDNSDVLLFLPGGIGTLYELMTSIEMKRSKEFNKPIIIYNETNFFSEILEMLDKIYLKNFTSLSVKQTYNVVKDYNAVIDLLNKFENKDNNLVK